MTETLDFATCPLEQLSVKDLTDALGIAKAAELLNTTARAMYTVRNTSALGAPRMMALIAAVKEDEATCRQRLIVTRRLQAERERRKVAA